MSSRILLVEDDPDVQLVVADLLKGHGHEVAVCGDGLTAVALAAESNWDVVILDVMLPKLDGVAACRMMREQGFDGPILMLTARASVDDRIEGLHTGADDYVVKPFDPNELLARVGAQLRRAGKMPLTPVRKYQFGTVTIDFDRGEVLREGTSVALAAKELKLLRYLIDHRGQLVSREQLLSRVWPEQPFIGPRTVDTHMAWLRQKLEDVPREPRYFITVRGEGYMFKP